MKMRLAFAALALLAPAGAAAADLLPLTRGIYVREGRACRGASNVDTMSYGGGRNGLNISRMRCAIRRMTRRGQAYSLHRRCRELHYGGSVADRIRVTIADRRSFTLRTQFTPPRGARFRYCGARVQF
ncbi:MAG TPA: hypothetical protein VES64_01405 [Allosphingosinicella sp.]|nr:hypothetical protein [Allosphingosinicella sp.]